jgi:hypothetical protein
VNTGCATIITTISGEQHAQALKHFLRTEVEPSFDRSNPREILKCQPRFPFDRIATLHFCSFTVLDGDGEFPPCLVFEATFDGSLDRFLDALLHVAAGAVDEIYRHCQGYPASGCATPELVKKYLARHDEGAHAFYLGNPGRTVAEIKDETQTYDALANSICQPWSRHKTMPATFSGLLRELRDVVSNQPGYRWAAQHMAAVPWEVAWRKVVPIAAVLAAVGAACLLGALVVGLSDHMNFDPQKPDWVRHLIFLLLMIAVSSQLLFVESVLRFLFRDPRRQSFWLRVSFHILTFAKYFFLVYVGTVILSIDPVNEQEKISSTWVQSPPDAVLMLIGAGFVFLLLQHWTTSVKLAVQFSELEPAREARKRRLLETLRIGMVVAAAFALLALIRSVLFLGPPPSGTLRDGAKTFFLEIMLGPLGLQNLAIYAVIGLIAAYALGCLVFMWLRVNERSEVKRFSSAEDLATFDNFRVYAREEGGINTYQNHLISLTYVKPGRLRALCLRLTLFVVGLLSRIWFNDGNLGGIPTILSARWVLIDEGRRLLFLDHYSGAWNNYLNEFIDMTAVFGLNAIWTNTFIKARGSHYAFPETEYYFWKGAQVERPFKAYVRHSQIETIVWYSAYPTVSTVNVNTNTEVRRSLFKPPVSCEIDSLLQNL